MSDAAREAYDLERKIEKAKKNFEKLCKEEKKSPDLIRVALYGFFVNGEEWSIDEITSKMNQQSNPKYHVRREIVQAYITYMTLDEILTMTHKDKYGLINNPKAIWGIGGL